MVHVPTMFCMIEAIQLTLSTWRIWRIACLECCLQRSAPAGSCLCCANIYELLFSIQMNGKSCFFFTISQKRLLKMERQISTPINFCHPTFLAFCNKIIMQKYQSLSCKLIFKYFRHATLCM